MGIQDTIRSVTAILDTARQAAQPDEITLRHALNEAWFSDALAWLLDPRGSHGLGVGFLRGFLEVLARERSKPACGYARRATHLRWSRAPGPGKSISRLRLGNACSLREFYLSAAVASASDRGSRYADVVVLDLDPKDGLFLVVENKLFGANHTGQLLDQLDAVESKYPRVPIREYAYLTLSGEPPTSGDADEAAILPRWVRLSWTGHVLRLLEGLAPRPAPRLAELVGLLRWLSALAEQAAANPGAIDAFEQAVIAAGAERLVRELDRLGEGRRGHWSATATSDRKARVTHSSAPRRVLEVTILPSFSLVVQSRYRSRARCDKLLVPFGAPPQQVVNLLQITARDLYWVHFDDPMLYLADRRRRTAPAEPEPLPDFIWRRRLELAALLGLARRQPAPGRPDGGVGS